MFHDLETKKINKMDAKEICDFRDITVRLLLYFYNVHTSYLVRILLYFI